jgi:hypothetical protein
MRKYAVRTGRWPCCGTVRWAADRGGLLTVSARFLSSLLSPERIGSAFQAGLHCISPGLQNRQALAAPGLEGSIPSPLRVAVGRGLCCLAALDPGEFVLTDHKHVPEYVPGIGIRVRLVALAAAPHFRRRLLHRAAPQASVVRQVPASRRAPVPEAPRSGMDASRTPGRRRPPTGPSSALPPTPVEHPLARRGAAPPRPPHRRSPHRGIGGALGLAILSAVAA